MVRGEVAAVEPLVLAFNFDMSSSFPCDVCKISINGWNTSRGISGGKSGML